MMQFNSVFLLSLVFECLALFQLVSTTANLLRNSSVKTTLEDTVQSPSKEITMHLIRIPHPPLFNGRVF